MPNPSPLRVRVTGHHTLREWAMDADHLGIWLWNPQTDEIRTNARALELFGVDPLTFDYTLNGLTRAMSTEDCAALKAALEKVQAENANLEIQFRVQHPDSTQHTLQSIGRCFTGGLIFSLLEDLTAPLELKLALVRGESRLQVDMLPVDLTTLVKECVYLVQHLARGHTLEVRPLDPVQVRGHPDTLKQLLLVLIENALKYTPEGGHIRVSLERQAERALFTVRDDGPGISVENLERVTVRDDGPGISVENFERVFERFFRVDGHKDAEKRGSGLGLAIARWIAEEHRGEVFLESALGEGTQAYVLLPLLQEEALDFELTVQPSSKGLEGNL